ncbi:DUF4943 family protein [Niabella aquatica]
MKKWILFTMIGMLFMGCKKDQFDINNPGVEKFVQLLKSGTYSEYERNEKGGLLWLKMPKFRQEHIAALIDLSKDTTHIQRFPTNPISSRTPIPYGRDYFVLGECLLWMVECVRSGGSLDPYLIDTSKDVNESYKGVITTEILIISDKYRQWWSSYKNGNWKGNDPLAGTSYRWM